MIKEYLEIQKGMLLQHLDPEKTKEFARMLEVDTDHFLVYLTILQSGPMTVAKVAMKLELDRGKTYRAVHMLQAMGYITETTSNPILVIAEEPEGIIKQLTDKHLDMAKGFQRLDAKDFFADLKTKKELPIFIKTAYISGMNNYFAKILQIIEQSKSTVMYLSQNTLKRIYYTNIPDYIKAHKKKFTIIANKLTMVKRLHPGIALLRTDSIDQDIIVTEDAVIFDVGPMNTTKKVNSFYYNDDDTNYMYTTNKFLIFIASTFLSSLNEK